MSVTQYNIQPWLTPVKLVATLNQVGTYYNGPLNNGVGATLTYAVGVVTIDGASPVLGDRVLLANQTDQSQNGIYVVTQVGAASVVGVLQRSDDFQCVEQMKPGFYVSVSGGVVNAGSVWTMLESRPAQVGVSPIAFGSTLTSVSNSISMLVVPTAAQLASAGKVVVQSALSTTSEFVVTDIKVLVSAGLSGGGGNRLLVLTDGTTVFNNAGITAALLGTPVFTLWGGSGNPIAAGTTDISAQGADLYLQYSGGTTDYTTGNVALMITLAKVKY